MTQSSTILVAARVTSLALFAWNVILFTRALRSHFTQPEGVPLLMRWLASCGIVTIMVDVTLLTWAEIRLPLALAGLGLLVASQLIFHAAVRATAQHKLSIAFSTDAPTHLNEAGIYRRVRHPFYLAYTLTWLGAATPTLHWAALVASVVMLGFYLTAANREEQKFIRSPLGSAYHGYRGRAGMFLPKFFYNSRYST